MPVTQLSPIAVPGGRYSFLAKTPYIEVHRQLYVFAGDRQHLNVAAGDRSHLNVFASDRPHLTVVAGDREG